MLGFTVRLLGAVTALWGCWKQLRHDERWLKARSKRKK